MGTPRCAPHGERPAASAGRGWQLKMGLGSGCGVPQPGAGCACPSFRCFGQAQPRPASSLPLAAGLAGFKLPTRGEPVLESAGAQSSRHARWAGDPVLCPWPASSSSCHGMSGSNPELGWAHPSPACKLLPRASQGQATCTLCPALLRASPGAASQRAALCEQCWAGEPCRTRTKAGKCPDPGRRWCWPLGAGSCPHRAQEPSISREPSPAVLGVPGSCALRDPPDKPGWEQRAVQSAAGQDRCIDPASIRGGSWEEPWL